MIANALDEQTLSNTAEIDMSKDKKGTWHIRDFGRGLRIEHFTLNENKEKLDASSGVIGKFGVGLKDALATFHRRGVDVLIRSPFGTFSLGEESKHGFDSIITLHVEYDDARNEMQGTEFILQGVSDLDMAKAKSLFLRFAAEDIVETNAYGQVLRRKREAARVYILGVLASDEPNFMFSYNITSLTDTMRKRLNRERLNVGRSTYSDRVKVILKNAASDEVAAVLMDQVEKRATGTQSDEMDWIEISQMALNLMHERRRVAFVTEQELGSKPDVLGNMRADGYDVVVVTEQQKAKLDAQAISGGPQVRTLERYVDEYNASFEYRFVRPGALSGAERQVYDQTPRILALVGLAADKVPAIRISETMRITSDGTEGVWDSAVPAVIIKRTRLSSLSNYAATLLHEIGHAMTHTGDATREFEEVLSGYLGKAAAAAVER